MSLGTGLRERLRNDSLKMTAATAVAAAANYGTNLWLARALDLDVFGDAALIVSSLLLLSAVAIAVQLSASHRTTAGDDAGLHRLRRNINIVGVVIAVAMMAAASPLARLLNSASLVSFVILGASIPIYLAMSIDRGMMQGERRFGDFGWSLVIEAVGRFVLTIMALAFVDGAAAAAVGMGGSFALTRGHAFLVHRRPGAAKGEPMGSSFPIGVPLVLLLLGQVLIANGDVIVVSAVSDEIAGTFAAVAVIGRLSFPLAWALINVAFPRLSTPSERAEAARTTALQVVALSLVTIVGTTLFGSLAASILFGGNADQISPHLVPYSIATGAFALASLGAVIDVGVGKTRGPAGLVVFGIIQTFALAIVASDGVGPSVWAQVVAMGAAAAYAAWIHRDLLRRPPRTVRQPRPTDASQHLAEN